MAARRTTTTWSRQSLCKHHTEPSEQDYQQARDELLKIRAEFAQHDDDKFFYVRQRGGDANIAKVGRALDCAAVFARKGVASQFCAKFQWPKQKSCHYSKFGGVSPANIVMNEFARKGNYFCSLWAASDCDDDFVFSREDLAGYRPSAEFASFAESLSNNLPANAAAIGISAWRPKGSNVSS